MVFGFDKTIHDAVIFLEDNRVIKEMLLPEFEAVLDGIVGEPELADKTCRAAYLKIDRKHNIIGAVFFLIDFDEDGNADPRWNLPLNQLVDTAAQGVGPNNAPLRIASSSQCQIPWLQESLWEPDLSSSNNTLQVLDAAIKANRLGLFFDDGADSNKFGSSTNNDFELETKEDEIEASLIDDVMEYRQAAEASAEERARLVTNIKKQRGYIASLKALHEEQITALKRDSDDIARGLEEDLRLAEQREEGLMEQAQLTRLELEDIQKAMDEQRAAFDTKLSRIADEHGVNHRELEEKYRKDFQRRLIEETSAIKEKLEMREVEIYYREEQINRLKSELAETLDTLEKIRSRDISSDIEALAAHGVHFVLSEPGIGPISIESRDVSRFNEDPFSYMAQRVGVDVELYIEWRDHVAHPVCRRSCDDGQPCGELIEAVMSPKDYVAGVSDCCARHQSADQPAVGNS